MRLRLAERDGYFVAGGAHEPLVRELKNVEVQGPLDLSFSASKGTPLICGVEVVAR